MQGFVLIVLNPKTGLLTAALQHTSPHHDARESDTDISLLVIHAISLPPGVFGGGAVHQFFMGRLDSNAHPYYQEIAHLTVSAHLYVQRTGQLHQYVPLCRRAWHAGRSSFQGRTACNDYSIGIELEGCDSTPFTDNQYLQLARVTRTIMQHYPKITRRRIVGHSDVAPGRKTDPGPYFDWQQFYHYLSSDKDIG